MKRVLYVLILLAIVFGWRNWAQREVLHPPGVLVPEAPRQLASAGAQPLQVQGYRL